MIGDRQAAAENDDADDEDRGGGIGDTVVERDGATDRLQRQERDGAERRIGDAGRRPAPRALGGEAERVVLQRLVCNPLIILASDAVDPLPPCHFVLLTCQRSRLQLPFQNLRRYFAVQYTRSCVSVQCTNSAILADKFLEHEW